jgi:hypothetical protein
MFVSFLIKVEDSRNLFPKSVLFHGFSLGCHNTGSDKADNAYRCVGWVS